MVRNHEVRGSIPLFSTPNKIGGFTPPVLFGIKGVDRTRKGATVGRKSGGLSSRERSEPTEWRGEGRQLQRQEQMQIPLFSIQ